MNYIYKLGEKAMLFMQSLYKVGMVMNVYT